MKERLRQRGKKESREDANIYYCEGKNKGKEAKAS